MPGWLIPGSKVAGVKLSRPPEFFGTAVLHGVAICSIAVVGGLATLERKLFGDISPFTYAIAVKRQILQRTLRDFSRRTPLATARDQHDLPVVIYKHNSLIRRKLGNVELLLQENKAVSLGLAAPHIDGILIKPGETFSFWHLVGHCSAKKGYKMGMTVNSNGPDSGIGGGLCQFTNLLHWMVLHSPLEIVEHHHHGAIDLFPDFNRQIPFGTGTSIVYNYLDYRVHNPTQSTFQFRVSLTEEDLRGELRATEPMSVKFHVKEAESYFQEVGDEVYRRNMVYRSVRDKRTGNEIANELIVESNAKVLYSRELINAPIRPEKSVASGR
ncbi:VanW family protein [Arthrobacter sp. BF1]|uniref:VanW family protein n=1 Tax=Arthrobacter sp. BF1 TaxID=2821145 RepID=UPI00211A4D5B|nr:VanW family protein [Arthrobacter sp. BF1]